MGEESLDCGDRGESSHSGPFSPTDRVFLTCSSVMKALRSMFSPALLRRQAYVYSDLMSALVTSRLSRLPTRLFPFFLSSSLPSTNLFVGLLGQAGRAHSVVHKGRRIPEAIPLRALNSKSVLSRESSKLHALVESLRGCRCLQRIRLITTLSSLSTLVKRSLHKYTFHAIYSALSVCQLPRQMTRLNSGRAERKENEAEECLHSLRGVCNTLHAQFPRLPSRPQTRRTREVRRTWDGKRRLYDHCASLFLSYVCRVYVSIQTTREPALGSESVLT